jgi:hypothetical protein
MEPPAYLASPANDPTAYGRSRHHPGGMNASLGGPGPDAVNGLPCAAGANGLYAFKPLLTRP